jgi:hypothetical protein
LLSAERFACLVLPKADVARFPQDLCSPQSLDEFPTSRLEPHNFYGLLPVDPVLWGERACLPGKQMKKLVFAILLVSSPAWAQTKLLPKNATARADNCAPIGRTADGKLVYSMKCENMPVPPPPPQAEIAAPPPEPEVQRSGIFGLSYERKRPSE